MTHLRKEDVDNSAGSGFPQNEDTVESRTKSCKHSRPISPLLPMTRLFLFVTAGASLIHKSDDSDQDIAMFSSWPPRRLPAQQQ